MSVQITLTNGMGITQGIAKELNLSKDDLKLLNKNGGAAIWTQVLNKAKAGQFTADGTFNGAEKITGRDANNLSKTEWKFNNGDVIQINQNKFDEIRQLINNKLASLKGSTATTSATTTPKATSSTPEQLPEGAADNVAAGRKVHAQQTLTINGKQVNVTKENGKFYLQNADGSQGEELILDAKTGDYKTRTQYIQDRTQVADVFMSALETTGAAKLENANDLANAMFVKYNKDDKGNISRDDFFNTELGDIEQSGQSLTEEQKQNLRGMSDIQFDLIDKDGNGEITESEYKAYLEGADINKDGSITAQEMEQYIDIAQRQNDVRDQEANIRAGQQAQTTPTSQSTTPWGQTGIGKIVMDLNNKLQQNNNTTATPPQDPLDAARNARGYSTTSASTQPTPQAQPKAAPQTSEHTQNTVQNNAQDVEYSDLSSMRNGQNVTINGETYSARYGTHGLVFDGPDGTYNLDEMKHFFEE